MTAPVVIADRLSKRFGTLTALDRLDLVVNRGEVFGYLGPNGAGKTTTIRLLLDALRPTGGNVVVLGGAPRVPATRARVGCLPAEFHVDPRYSANDLLEFSARCGVGSTGRTPGNCANASASTRHDQRGS